MRQSLNSILSEKTIESLKAAIDTTDNEKLVEKVSFLMEAENNIYKRKFSQKDIADIIGESEQTAGYTMRLRRKMSIKDLACISVFFGLSIDSMIFGDSYHSEIDKKMSSLQEEIKQREEQLKKADMLNKLLMEKLE